MKLLASIPFFILLNSIVLSQAGNTSEIINSIAEELAGDETDPAALGDFLEKLRELEEKPVKLNTADETEISRLFFLTDFQVKALADYIRTIGNIYTVYEIANIPGFDREQTELLLPFISISQEQNPGSGSSRIKSTLLTNWSFRFPETDDSVTGSLWKILARYKLVAGNISGGFTAEKDKGEKLLSGKPPLPDFTSAFLAYTGSGILKKIILGDFSGRYGLGTNINTGLRGGLSLTSSGYLSGGEEIRPYTSTDENNFFRGVATSFRFGKTGITAFYSTNRIDATIDTIDSTQGCQIRTFYIGGLHHTLSLLKKKDVVRETGYGLSVSYDLKNVRIGAIWSDTRFSLPVREIVGRPGNLFDFKGNRNCVASAWYKAAAGKMILFGELSYSMDNHTAFVQGLSFRPSDRLIINLVYRHYTPGFKSFHGKGFLEGSGNNNIKGLFGNFTFEAGKHLFLSAGCDLRYHPWMRYRCSSPSLSKSSEVRIKYIPSEKFSVKASYNYRSSVVNDPEGTGIIKQTETESMTFKGEVKYSAGVQADFVTRVDYKFTSQRKRGMLLLQDVRYRMQSIPLSFWLRYCIYRTEDWESRLYTYENDLVQSYSVPAVSGTGTRCYLMLEWEFINQAEFRIRYSVTDTADEEAKTSGGHEVKIQFRFRF